MVFGSATREWLLGFKTAKGIGVVGATAVALATALVWTQAPQILVGLWVVIGLGVAVYGIRSLVESIPIFSPMVLIPSFMLIYYGIGSWNITTYRGEVSDATMKFAYVAILCFLGGCAIIKFIDCCAPLGQREESWDRARLNSYTVIALLVGAGAVLLACVLHGIPLLDSRRRFEVSPYISFLAGLAWIGPLFAFVDSLKNSRPSKRLVFIMVVGIGLVCILGYRTPLAIFGFSALVCFGLIKGLSFRKAFLAISGLILLISSFYFLRMNVIKEGGDRGTFSTLMETYEAPAWLSPFLSVYLTCREGTAIFDKIHRHTSESGHYGGDLIVADLVTILPGEQKSGGAMVLDLIGGTGIAGLTPSILGAFYLDWGTAGMFFGPAILGMILMGLYLRAKRGGNAESVILYAVVLSYSIHLVHRGVFAAQYVFDIGMVVLAIMFIRSGASAYEGRRAIRVSRSAELV